MGRPRRKPKPPVIRERRYEAAGWQRRQLLTNSAVATAVLGVYAIFLFTEGAWFAGVLLLLLVLAVDGWMIRQRSTWLVVGPDGLSWQGTFQIQQLAWHDITSITSHRMRTWAGSGHRTVRLGVRGRRRPVRPSLPYSTLAAYADHEFDRRVNEIHQEWQRTVGPEHAAPIRHTEIYFGRYSWRRSSS